MPKKIIDAKNISNLFFAEAEDKTAIKFAGIAREIEDKETPTGTAKRFKGDFAFEMGDEVYRARYAFFPTAIREPILAGLAKLGKWGTDDFAAEFMFKAVKNGQTWTVDFTLAPRIEQPRVIALLG